MRTRNRAPQEKMPDEELSRHILFYGHLANLCAYGCIAGAVLGVLAGILLQSFTAGCTIVMLVIVAAVFLIQLIHAMQSSLILGQLGDGFMAALHKAFGPQPEHRQWPMSDELARRSGLFPEEWESASAHGSYEGSYQGIPFAMHNASLIHVWEVRDPMPDDPHNTRTCSKTIFKGLFLVCRMRRPMAPEPFALPGEFDLAPESWKQQLQRAVDARALRISFRGDLMFAAFDTDRMIQDLEDLKAGKTVQCPVYDYAIHDRTEETLTLAPNKVILVEGILIFENKALRDLMDIKIFVDTDADVRILRRILRDVKERGRTLESVMEQYLTTVKPMHEQFVEPSKRYADVIVPEGGKNLVALMMIVQRIAYHIEHGDVVDEQ